jgi:hypothetical protein
VWPSCQQTHGPSPRDIDYGLSQRKGGEAYDRRSLLPRGNEIVILRSHATEAIEDRCPLFACGSSDGSDEVEHRARHRDHAVASLEMPCARKTGLERHRVAVAKETQTNSIVSARESQNARHVEQELEPELLG